MKRFFSLLLTVAMLLAMIPAVIVGASAEVTSTPTQNVAPASLSIPAGLTGVPTTVVDGTVSYKADGSASVDWKNLNLNGYGTNISIQKGVYTDADSVEHGVASYVIGKYSNPVTVSAIAVFNHYWTGRLNNTSIYLSTNGTEWTQVISIASLSHAKASRALYYEIPAEYANTKWSYVKFEHLNSGWHDSTGIMSLTKDAVTSTTGNAKVNATHNVSSDAGLADVWNNTNFVQKNFKEDGTKPVYTTAKLENPTIITEIGWTSSAQGDRARTGKVYASVDGENWDHIATLGACTVDRYTEYTSTATKAYLYVKVEQGDGFWEYDWSSTRIAVYGTPSGCQVTDTQQKIAQDGLTYAVRFVSKVDSLTDYSAVGYKITATAEGMTTKTWKESSTTVYSSIKALVGGVETTVEAGEGKYYFTATVENISIEKYADVTFVIEAFVVVDGVEMYSAPVTVVFNDGVRV